MRLNREETNCNQQLKTRFFFLPPGKSYTFSILIMLFVQIILNAQCVSCRIIIYL